MRCAKKTIKQVHERELSIQIKRVTDVASCVIETGVRYWNDKVGGGWVACFIWGIQLGVSEVFF